MRRAMGAAASGVSMVLLLSCGSGSGIEGIDTAGAQARAERAADELAGTLISRLTDALHDEGAVPALTVCSEVAQELTSEIGEEHGLAIRRTSLRTRNPLNAPDPYERRWLEQEEARFGANPELHPTPTTVIVETPSGGWELRYVRPLFLAELCVQCHGAPERLAEGIPEALARLYPEDRATGFAPGDLRGVISVRVPLGE
ncbi:MAG: DUF3365 domain-containing protein [Acidobacteriota bacterium]|nr:DUF3365 domain-containing protein [Acidobacteriota bacterium]